MVRLSPLLSSLPEERPLDPSRLFHLEHGHRRLPRRFLLYSVLYSIQVRLPSPLAPVRPRDDRSFDFSLTDVWPFGRIFCKIWVKSIIEGEGERRRRRGCVSLGDGGRRGDDGQCDQHRGDQCQPLLVDRLPDLLSEIRSKTFRLLSDDGDLGHLLP